jgi:hypothetical protein
MNQNQNISYLSLNKVNIQEGAPSDDPSPQIQEAAAHPGVMDNSTEIHLKEAALVPPAQIHILTDQTTLEMRYPDLSVV